MNPLKLMSGVTFAEPRALYLLVLVAAVLAWSLFGVRTGRQVIAPLMRALALALVVLALAGPQRIIRSLGATRPVVVDASASITPSMRRWSAKLLRDTLGLKAADPAIIFGGQPSVETAGRATSLLEQGKPCDSCAPASTDLEAALDKLGQLPDARGGPVVLVTDGWETRGDALRAENALIAAGIRLYIFTPQSRAAVRDVAMTQLSLPPALPHSAPFTLGVTLANHNDTAVNGTLSVYENGRLLKSHQVQLSEGRQRFDFKLRPPTSGLIAYRAAFAAANPAQDLYQQNDSLTEWIGVGARRKILILTDSARDSRYLEQVVKRAGFEPAVVTQSSGQFNGPVDGYGAILLNNIPRARLSSRFQEALTGYVRHGGSLAMIGGDRSFGLGGYQNSAVADAMPVTMKPPEHKQKRRALILIIDKSGSMGRNKKLVYAKAAADSVTHTLKPTDLVGVIGFDSQPFVVVPLESLAKIGPDFSEMVNQLKALGTTYLLPALQEADRMLASMPATSRHVVILTDGETGGTAPMYYDLVSTMHHDGGVTVSTIAVGDQANVKLLQSISKYGGGTFYHTTAASNLPKIFLRDVKSHGGENTMVEREFVPHGTSPDPLLGDLAARRLPPLKGYVSTKLKPRAALSLFVERDRQREPLIASWKYGAGKALAVTTDASGRWSGPWIGDGLFAKVWNKLLSWLTPQNTVSAENYAVALGYRDGAIRLRLINYDARPGTQSGPGNAVITRPDGSTIDATLTQDALGELSGTIDAPLAGTYRINLKPETGTQQKPFPPLAYTVSPAAMAELPRSAPNYGLLEQLASATGGLLNPPPTDVALTRPEIERALHLGPYCLLAAMILIIGEALARRLTY